MSEELREAIVSLPSRIEIPPRPSVDQVRRRGRRRQVTRRVGATCAFGVIALAVWGTLNLVPITEQLRPPREGGLAGDPSPSAVRGRDAYVFSNIRVIYPARSPSFALVKFNMAWGTEEFPGVYECSWTVYGNHGKIVGEATDAVPLLRSRQSARGMIRYVRISGPPEDAEIRCDGSRLDSPGGDFGRASPAPGNQDPPRGAFESCPDLEGTLPVDSKRSHGAERVAVEFDTALVKDQEAAIERLADPSVESPATASWASTLEARDLGIGRSESAASDSLVTFGCGAKVADRSWAVTITDNNEHRSASMGSATFYLVRRAEGWRVWGSY